MVVQEILKILMEEAAWQILLHLNHLAGNRSKGRKEGKKKHHLLNIMPQTGWKKERFIIGIYKAMVWLKAGLIVMEHPCIQINAWLFLLEPFAFEMTKRGG